DLPYRSDDAATGPWLRPLRTSAGAPVGRPTVDQDVGKVQRAVRVLVREVVGINRTSCPRWRPRSSCSTTRIERQPATGPQSPSPSRGIARSAPVPVDVDGTPTTAVGDSAQFLMSTWTRSPGAGVLVAGACRVRR